MEKRKTWQCQILSIESFVKLDGDLIVAQQFPRSRLCLYADPTQLYKLEQKILPYLYEDLKKFLCEIEIHLS